MKKNDRTKAKTPKGFLFSAVEAAIKKPGRKDLALICSEKEAVMSGMFTTNTVKAAPVKLDMKRIKAGKGQAIIVNSGNANACSGKQGAKDAAEMTGLIAGGLKLDQGAVYVCSTGVIGTPMPMDRIRGKVPELLRGLGTGTIHDVAAAIMTTDTFSKVVTKKIKVGNKTGTITGICKGAGMICPHMATMLCFIVTDLKVAKTALDKALRGAVENSFNRITIDGDMSTNDTVLIMANGMAGNEVIRESSGAFKTFVSALSGITHELSRLIVMDGEGATKIVEIEVKNAWNKLDAEKAASAIANSLLVKTALYGNDANWGRIMAALGYSGTAIREDKTDISFGKVKLVKNGIATGKDKEATAVLKKKELRITVDLHIGKASSKVLTCDLTEAYVRINAEYRT
ncbi:MAG: bifunctional glutamate N-acetyltransferase/amino-acid acetyltransferase ArgJ [Nitrospirae bacterium]|nr:bifunctional glutamate N-acetyltransferase/amino-acid acetyltransferase ArgJ [Nitrospirota bacterium]MCL5421458.1 bifunctional glutamate N-acetyltransferase/amino-acid acetyltransferase ArgJ [Nitrospirota bacterium]